jgi:hypothetical protein
MNLFIAAVFNIMPLRPICLPAPECAAALTYDAHTSRSFWGSDAPACANTLAQNVAAVLGSADDPADWGDWAEDRQRDALQEAFSSFYDQACDTGWYRKFPDGSTQDLNPADGYYDRKLRKFVRGTI